MIKNLLLSTFFLLFGFNSTMAQNVEELALRVLIDSVYTSYYDESKVIFSGFTELENPTTMPFFDVDGLEMKEILNESIEQAELSPIKIDIATDNLKLKKYSLINKPRIQVYPRILYDDNFYVYITVYKKMSFVGHHLFEFDRSNNRTNSWYAGEII